MSNILLVLNDAPYGSERSYNALRLVRALLDKGGSSARVFLIGDAVTCAHAGQKVPSGYYNIGDMLGAVVCAGGEVGVCGSCLDARGMVPERLVAGVRRSSMDQLAAWTAQADKVLVF